jgi:hypothetical protein
MPAHVQRAVLFHGSGSPVKNEYFGDINDYRLGAKRNANRSSADWRTISAN